MKKRIWILNLALLLTAAILFGMVMSNIKQNIANAQAIGEVGNLIIIAGGYRDRDAHPFFMVDTKLQTLLCYTYNEQTM